MSLPDTSVKYFDSTMAGSPVLSGTAGALIGVLDACLVNGFGSVTINSLSVSDNVATAVVSAEHNFPLVGSVVGSVIEISGATPSALNGQWRIATVPSNTTFTFATSGIANGTATGTITAKRASAGWEKRYSGTNKAAYKRLDPTATAMLLFVDDAAAQDMACVMYESMTSIDLGSGPAPTSGAYYLRKSTSVGSTARAWIVAADQKSVYVFVKNDGANWRGNIAFCDLNAFLSPDPYACLLIGSSLGANDSYLYALGSANYASLSRSYTFTGGPVGAIRRSHAISTSLGTAAANYPNPAGSEILTAPVDVWEGTTCCRGTLPGVLNLLHQANLMTQGSVFVLPNEHTYSVQYLLNGASGCAIDLTGPWR